MPTQKLIDVLKEHNGIMTTKMLTDAGVSKYTVTRAVASGAIERYVRGVYLLDAVYYDDLYLLQLRYSKGVYSHETAVMLHTLSTFSPFVYHVSFEEGYHLLNAKENHIKPYYVNERELSEDCLQVIDSWDSNPIKVTNLEKTIVDMLRYKTPMPGIVDEMINDYVARDDANVERLLEYGLRFGIIELIEQRILPYVKR